MITEDYVSFEIAKLLKEKGFDEGCRQYWYKGNIVFSRSEIRNRELDNYEDEGWTAPTLQMAMKWLRETFEIHCQIDCPIAASNWVYGIRNLDQDEWIALRNMGDYDTYEEACEAAIKYCLENLI